MSLIETIKTDVSVVLVFFEKAAAIAAKDLPFVETLLTFIPGGQALLLAAPAANVIIGAIPGLCATAEKILGGGNGAAKSDLVNTMINAAIQSVSKAVPSTAAALAKIQPLVQPAIELAVNNANVLAAGK